jgi:hypothetical protein
MMLDLLIINFFKVIEFGLETLELTYVKSKIKYLACKEYLE